MSPEHYSCNIQILRSTRSEVFLRKRILKICSKFTGEHPCRNVISIKLLCNFIEIALRHGCSTVNVLHIFRTPFPQNSFGGIWILLLDLTTIMNELTLNHVIHIHASLHKKRNFPLMISSVNVTKSAGNCRFGHIY